MPLYQGDLEAREGMPPQARRLKALLADHHALLLVSPENNASVPALLKNTLDWLSRPDGGQNGLVAFQGKVALLMAASPGSLGGLRGLAHLRQILQALSVLVLTEQLAVPRAHEPNMSALVAPVRDGSKNRSSTLVTGFTISNIRRSSIVIS